MALGDLLRVLEMEGAARAEARIAEGRDAAERLIANSVAESEQRRAAAVAIRERELRAAAALEVATAKRMAIRAVLEARAVLLDQVRAGACTLLAEKERDPAWLPTLEGEVDAALAYVGDVPVVIRCPPELAGGLRDRLSRRAGMRVEADGATTSGSTVRTEDGSVEISLSPQTRLARLWPRMSIDLIRELEPQS